MAEDYKTQANRYLDDVERRANQFSWDGGRREELNAVKQLRQQVNKGDRIDFGATPSTRYLKENMDYNYRAVRRDVEYRNRGTNSTQYRYAGLGDAPDFEQIQRQQTQQRTTQIQQETQQIEKETETLGEQITQQKEEIQGLQRTRRRTVRSALQPNENLFSVLGRSQRSTLG